MKTIHGAMLEEIIEQIESGGAYERQVALDVKAGDKEGHVLGEACEDDRMGFADGIDQAVFMLREFVASA